jgi:hypothetical protein
MELNTFAQLSFILYVRYCTRSTADYDAGSNQQPMKRHIKVLGCYFSILIGVSNLVPPAADLTYINAVNITEQIFNLNHNDTYMDSGIPQQFSSSHIQTTMMRSMKHFCMFN